jgi:hypothetical protein
MDDDSYTPAGVARRLETELRGKIIKQWNKDGFYAISVNDRFASARPDMRLGIGGIGQLDIELKYLEGGKGVLQSGLTALQKIEIRDMNRASMPAIALTYHDLRRVFIIHHEREVDLDSTGAYVIDRLKGPAVIDARELMAKAYRYITKEIGRG